MKLWSFQSADIENLLEKQHVFFAEWKFTPPNWRAAYEWMAKAMEGHEISLNGKAPVWAWQSCRAAGRGPTIGTALDAYTDFQLLSGIVLIEMEVPGHLCLCSTYSGFLQLLDEVIDYGTVTHPEAHQEMFQIPEVLLDDDIQAAIPFIRKEWILDIRSVDIKPGKSDFDPAILL